MAQTFTADKSGTLTEVDLWMGWDGGGTATVTASIENTSSGAPVGSALATAIATVTSTPAWVAFFPTPQVAITSGTAYAIVFTTGSDVHVCTADPYTGAQSWAYDGGWMHYGPAGSSFAYRTFLAAATAAPPTLAMAFGAASIPVGGTASLTYTINNPNTVPTLGVRPAGFLPTGTLTDIAFTDTLPAGLLIATPNNIVGSCGTITATAGTNLVSMTGLTLAAGVSCGFGIDVIGVAPGVQANTTSAITSTQSDPGAPATASITVTALSTPAPTPTKAATPPPTSTDGSRGPGGESPLLPLLALAAVAVLAATTFVLRPESRVHRR